MFLNVLTCISVIAFICVCKSNVACLLELFLMFVVGFVVNKVFKKRFDTGTKTAVSLSLLIEAGLFYYVKSNLPEPLIGGLQMLVAILGCLLYAFFILTYFAWKCEKHVKKLSIEDDIVNEHTKFESAVEYQTVAIIAMVLASCAFFYVQYHAFMKELIITNLVVVFMCVAAKLSITMVCKDRVKKLSITQK